MSGGASKVQPSDSYFGYEIKARLGAGGYGEVWAAEAPGGLRKAIKFVYGFHDEERAQRELKSLNHIKEVRHPFLLSLERIDVVDGQLVIVTELADESLKDRFKKCVKEGQRGIPRDELLRYMQEAADGLDYINHEHSLQHLDIKPENLLLVGGHVKVADFGLVKQIHDATASMMGGLTPLYAPPELFDGRPSRQSDQYSLAIVYQEMLTGTRPLQGETAAQMAAQHLRGRPNLSKLPRTDRYVIARALAKDPSARHADCRDLVKELRDSVTRVAHDEGQTPGSGNSQGGDSDPMRSSDTITKTAPIEEVDTRIVTLPPVEMERAEAEFIPSLIIGIGSTGLQVLRHLRRRIHERIGIASEIPAVQLLAIDADADMIRHVSSLKSQECLQSAETLATPLKTSEEYRNTSQEHLSWLSRRWLYNIPRTGLTEGIRPLGRLAFADHVLEVRERVAAAIKMINDRHHIDTTAKRLHLNVGDALPSVTIIGSCAGGFASGCMLDLAYLTRALFSSLGLPDDNINGFMIHSTARGHSRENDLSIANTYAYLTEYFHYARHGYPGDNSTKIPNFGPGQAPFDYGYFLDFGSEIWQNEFSESVDRLAEYIYLGTVTPCGSLLNRCRTAPRTTKGPTRQLSLRSVDLSRIGGKSDVLIHDFATRLCVQLLRAWVEGSEICQTDGPFDPVPLWNELREQMHLSRESACRDAGRLMTRTLELPRDEAERADALLQRYARDLDPHTTGESWTSFVESIDELYEVVRGQEQFQDAQRTTQAKETRVSIATFGRRVGECLAQVIEHLVEAPDVRIYGSTEAAALFLRELRAVREELQESENKLVQSRDASALQLIAQSGDPTGQQEYRARDIAATLVELQHRIAETRVAQRVMALIIGYVEEAAERLDLAKNQLNRLREAYQMAVESAPPDESDDISERELVDSSLDQILVDHLTANESEMVKQFEAVCRETLSDRQRGVNEYLLSNRSHDIQSLGARMRHIARAVVRRTVQQCDTMKTVVERSQREKRVLAILSERIASSEPTALTHGGDKRLVAIGTAGTAESSLRQFLTQVADEPVSWISCDTGEAIVLCESDNIPAGNLALKLISHRPECREYAARLKTRTDVKWSSLTGIL